MNKTQVLKEISIVLPSPYSQNSEDPSVSWWTLEQVITPSVLSLMKPTPVCTVQNVSVWTAKRPHVLYMWTCCRYTRRRFECTHNWFFSTTTTTTTTTPIRGPAAVSWRRGWITPSGFAPDGEARSWPGVTVAGGSRGLHRIEGRTLEFP